jgi:hypothetical protein
VGLAWSVIQYALGRWVKVDVTASADHRDTDGISVEVRNRSIQRSVEVCDVEILHKPGCFRRRVAEAAGPLMEPGTPWQVAADSSTSGWVRLKAVDGSGLAPGSEPKWNFERPIRVRLKLAAHRGPKSKRVRVKP